MRIVRAVVAMGMLALCGMLAHPAPAAVKVKLAQKRFAQISSGETIVVKLPKPNVAGDLIVAYVVWDNAGPVTVTDANGNAYATAVGPTVDATDGLTAEVLFAPGVAAGANAVTAHFGSAVSARGALYVDEYAGLDAGAPLGPSVVATGSAVVLDTGVLPVGSSGGLLFVGAATNKAVTRVGKGWKVRTRRYGNMVADRVFTAAGGYELTAKQKGTAWIAQMVAFTAAGATTDTTPPSVPANVHASGITSNAATIAWSPSQDDTGVAGYRLFRNGAAIGTTTQTHYTDTNLTPSTGYTYAVAAYDAAGNVSAASSPPLDVTTAAGPPGVVYPVKVDPTGRHLVDQNGTPFLLTGDSPQALIVNLSEADADAFFANRQSYGFNAVWINLLCATYTGGRADGSTYDGIVPFTTPMDLSTPNEAYFTRVDHMVALAAQHGMTVFLDPAETGSFLSVLTANGVTKARAYGRYLGTRYRNVDNIVWMSGNDFQTWPNAADDAVVQSVARGIQDTDDRHIHTVELDYQVSGSLDDPTWGPIIQLNASYTYFPTYAQVLTDYDRPGPVPTFMVEANYEGEHNAADLGTPAILRRQEYWTLLSGATGQLYGNRYTWPFIPDWQSNLDTPGSVQMSYVKFLFQGRRWYDLVPDQAHAVVTAGYGTYVDSGALGDSDYVTAARTGDGALVMAYLPTVRTVTVDMTKLAVSANASWYDPSTGVLTAVPGSPFADTGTRGFTPPGANAAGDGDWVLVLEATSVPPDTHAPSVPAGLAASPVSATEIDVSWTASTDDVGVAGYRVYRDGTLVKTTASTAFADTGLSPSTAYSYTVAAYDFASNASAQSAPVVASTAGAGAGFVQVSSATPQTPQSTVGTTYASAQTAGDTNIIAIGWNDTVASITTVGDGAGNVYQQAVATFRGNGMSQAIFYAAGIAAAGAGANQVTVTFDRPAVFVDVRASEYAGLRTTAPFDAGVSATGVGALATVGPVGTAGPSELLFAAGMTGTSFGAAGTGFTSRVITSPDGDIVEDALAGSPGTYTASAPLGPGTWLLQLAAFVPAP